MSKIAPTLQRMLQEGPSNGEDYQNARAELRALIRVAKEVGVSRDAKCNCKEPLCVAYRNLLRVGGGKS